MNKNYKKGTMTVWVLIILLVAIVGVILYAKTILKQSPATIENVDGLAGLQTGQYPWPPEILNLKTRLYAIGLPALSEEGSVLHSHEHLDILIDGQNAPVPSEIGVSEQENFISPIHTHDNTQVIHIESPTIQIFTLGQFFDIWGVKFTADCIGGYCSSDDKVLRVFVNGNEIKTDPRLIELAEHQEIFVFYGVPADLPAKIPDSYTFGPGL